MFDRKGAERVEYWPVERLAPHARNARVHSDSQIADIASSIARFGFNAPVLVDGEGGIIAGHGRVLAAKRLGLDDVPVVPLSHLSDREKRAYILADNRLAEKAGWDQDLLRVELADLRDLDFDLHGIGWDDKELDKLLAAPITEDQVNADEHDDEVPAAAEATVTRLGDIWQLGRHRLRCGDSTSPDDVAALMAGEQAALCFTSPPYSSQRDYTTGGIGDWDALMRGVFGCLPMTEGGQVLVNLGLVHAEGEWMPYWDGWIAWMRTEGWRRFGFYVLDQGPGLPGDWNGRLAPAHEFIFHFNRKQVKVRKIKDCKHAGAPNHGSSLRKKDGTISAYSAADKAVQAKKVPDSVVRVMRHKARGIECGHPAVFPVQLATEMQQAFSAPGDAVFEPFGGSGTAIVAAEKTGRRCFAMELAPAYADIAVRRWQEAAGDVALLQATGQSFDQVATERQA